MTATAPATEAGRPAAAPLRANRDFRLLWCGQALSDFGSAMTALVLPLALLRGGHSTSAAGTLGTAVLLTAMVARMPAGYLTDRHSHRRLMLTADLGRLLAVGTVAVWTFLGRLPVALAVSAVIVAQLGVELFRPSQNATVRRVVPAEQLGSAIAMNQARAYGAGIVAPAAAGLLIAVSTGLPFAIDAGTFLASALCVLALTTVRRPGPSTAAPGAVPAAPGGSPAGAGTGTGEYGERPGTGEYGERTAAAKGAGQPDGAAAGRAGASAAAGPPRERFWPRLTAGLRYVVTNRFLRALAALAAGENFLFQALAYALVLGVGREHDGAAAVGLAMSAAAVTGLTGSLIAPFLQRRLHMQAVMAAGPAFACALLAVAWATGSGVALAAGYSALCLLTPVNGAVFGTILATSVPEEIYGRTTTALGFVSEILQPLGPLAAGLLLASLSLSGIAALFTVAFGALAGLALLLPRPTLPATGPPATGPPATGRSGPAGPKTTASGH